MPKSSELTENWKNSQKLPKITKNYQKIFKICMSQDFQKKWLSGHVIHLPRMGGTGIMK